MRALGQNAAESVPPSPFLPQDSRCGNAAWAPLRTPNPDPVRAHRRPHEVGQASVFISTSKGTEAAGGKVAWPRP